MPVTQSAKRALLVAGRRHAENLIRKDAYKGAMKDARKAAAAGAEGLAALFSAAQRALDTAAKSKTIHPNKAARLKSRLSKRMALPVIEAPAKKAAAKKAVPKNKKKA